MDLVIFLSFSYLLRLTYNSHAVSYASLFVSHPCLMHSSPHSSPCSAWLCSSFLLFHSATAVWLPHVSLPFHGYAWCMPLMHAATYLGYVGTHWLDLIYTCTYIPGSIKGHKCQPENSSLVLLVFPHNSQWEYLLNRLLAPLVSSWLLRFPRAPVDAVAIGLFQIDPLWPPFEPIPPEVMAQVLHALALSQPIQPIPPSPSLPTPEQPGEETQPTNNQPNLPKDNASPTPLVLEPTEALLNGDIHDTTQGGTWTEHLTQSQYMSRTIGVDCFLFPVEMTHTEPVPCKVRYYTWMSELPPTSCKWNPSTQKE